MEARVLDGQRPGLREGVEEVMYWFPVNMTA
jgi:hypothetical protein